jgi:myo-inositol 2-dehydrogenase / D-chiro-inositol 1-dehydrogenase
MTTSRREFVKTSAATAGAVAAAGSIIAPAVHAAGSDILKLGVIGLGGRGSGAVRDALTADPNTKLVAACDIFPDLLDKGMVNLKKSFDKRIDCGEKLFTGFDGYKKVIDSDIDVVLLTTSPGFRPLHFAYAVEKGRHVFMEKPHATDVAGIRSVLETAKKAKEKGLGVCSGFTYRADVHKRLMMEQIHNGAIGNITTVHCTYNTGPLWHRDSETKNPNHMEYQLRNWYYFSWLSGDFIVEQAIHNIDKLAWIMNGKFPIAAVASGGRQVRTDPKYGNIYDHFSVVYEYENGVRAFHQCRQMKDCQGGVIDHMIGTKGHAEMMKHTIESESGKWVHPENDKHDLQAAYVLEHKELYDSIRAGKPMNDAERSAYSTMMGLMGREAAYSGKRITWKQMLEGKQNLQPAAYEWAMNPMMPVPTPGIYKFV